MKIKKVLFFFFLGVLLLLILFVSFRLPFILVEEHRMNFEGVGAYGDMFGCFNSIMSALAFIGLIVTIILQRKDFNQTIRDVELQMQLQLKQCELMREQLDESKKEKRAVFLNNVIEKIVSDAEISEFISMVDYGKKWYNDDFHGGSKEERLADKTLAHLSYVLYLRKEGAISESEFHFVKYFLKRVLNDSQLQSYLFNLYHFDKANFLYQNLVDYAKQENLLKPEFFDVNAGRNIYDVYLSLNR